MHFHRKMLRTEEAWVREINAVSAVILLVYTVTCAVVGRDVPPSNLTVPTVDGHVTGHVTFNCRNVLLYALLVESFVRLHAAAYPHLTTVSFIGNTPTLRLFFMTFTFPAINAAVLVGVGLSTSLWSVFAVIGMTLLMLCCSWMISVSSVQKPAVILISIIGLSLYLATWILAWLTSADGLSFGLICFVVAVVGLIIFYIVLQIARSNNLFRDNTQLEFFLTCASLFVYILGQALWAATARTKTSPIMSPWIAFIVTGVVIIFFSLFAWLRMPKQQMEDAATDLETSLVPPLNAGIDTDDDQCNSGGDDTDAEE